MNINSQNDPEAYRDQLLADIKAIEISIAAYDKKIEKVQEDEQAAIAEGEKARDIANQKGIEKLKESIKAVSQSASRATEETSELEKWAAIAYKIAENPEESPFKLMNKTLGVAFKYGTYEERVSSADKMFTDWVDSLKGKQSEEEAKREQVIHEFFFGQEKVLSIAEAFPQYFNRFQYEGDQSKQIESWYGPDSWKGVGEAYYQEAVWRRSVILDLKQRVISLEWALFRNQTSPNEDLPNQPLVTKLREWREELEKSKVEREALLEKYNKDFLLAKQKLDAHGAEPELAEKDAHIIATAENQSSPAAESTQSYNFSDQRREINPDASHASTRSSNTGNTSGSREYLSGRNTLQGNVRAFSDPWFLTNILGQGALDAIRSQLALGSGLDYEFLSPPQREAADRFRKRGVSFADAIKYALAMESYPEFANLSLDELARVSKFMEQGNSVSDAIKFALQTQNYPSVYDLLSDEEKSLVDKFVAKGMPMSQAIEQALLITSVKVSPGQEIARSGAGERVFIQSPSSPKATENAPDVKIGRAAQETLNRLGKIGRQQSRQSRFFGLLRNQIAGGAKAPATNAAAAAAGAGAKGLLAKAGAVAGVAGLAISHAAAYLLDEKSRKRLAILAASAGGGLYLIFQYLTQHILASGTAVLGGIFLGPIGLLPGFAVGLGIENALGIGGAAGPGIFGGTAGATGTATATTTSTSGIAALSGGAAPVLIATGTVCACGLVVAVAAASAFVIEADASEVYEAPRFTVSKEIVSVNGVNVPDRTIENIGAGTAEIIYKITFTSKGEEIILSAPTDKVMSYKAGREPSEVSPAPSLLPGESYPTSLGPNESKSVQLKTIINGGSGAIFDDSRLVNSFSVVGTLDREEKPITETQNASVSLKIGNPIDTPPYGFPIAGNVNSLDYDLIKGGGCTGRDGKPDNTHCGEFQGKSVKFGGIDIGGTGEVKSTLDGVVEVSSWDEQVGGKIVIRSEAYGYRVLFLHLKDPRANIREGDEITRGQIIGEIFPGKLGNTFGNGHIHYQILQDGENLPFATAPAGECLLTEGNIMTLDQKAIIDDRVANGTKPAITSGPWEGLVCK